MFKIYGVDDGMRLKQWRIWMKADPFEMKLIGIGQPQNEKEWESKYIRLKRNKTVWIYKLKRTFQSIAVEICWGVLILSQMLCLWSESLFTTKQTISKILKCFFLQMYTVMKIKFIEMSLQVINLCFKYFLK